jgi:hypothetical protein
MWYKYYRGKFYHGGYDNTTSPAARVLWMLMVVVFRRELLQRKWDCHDITLNGNISICICQIVYTCLNVVYNKNGATFEFKFLD